MNERIRELAREAGFYANSDVEKFEKFAALVEAQEREAWEQKFARLQNLMGVREIQPNKPCCLAARADEREECAKECERMMMYPNAKQESAAHQNVWAAAKAIRARGTT